MKIFFVIMGCAVIIAGAAISMYLLMDRQFALFDSWDIALIFGSSLLISVIPFALAVILTRLDKVERAQRDDYSMLDHKINQLEKTPTPQEHLTSVFHDEPPKDLRGHVPLFEPTPASTARTDGFSSAEEFFEAVRSEHGLDPLPAPPAPPQITEPSKIESPPVTTYKGMQLNKIIRTALLSAGIVCLLTSGYYFFQVVSQSLWDDTVFRIAQLILFFGGVSFMALSRILMNQEKIIRLSLKRRNEIDNARFTDNKR